MDPLFLMNIQRIKALTWVGTLAVGGWLAWSVYDFLEKKPELTAGISQADQLAVLQDIEEPEPPRDDRVDINVINTAFTRMNWTGKFDPKPVMTEEEEGKDPPLVAVSTLLSVLVVQVDSVDPIGSLALVRWLDPELEEMALEQDRRILRTGDELLPPHDAITVAAISIEGVEFSFPEGERESELVAPVVFPGSGPSIVKVGEDGAILPPDEERIKSTGESAWHPDKESYQVGKNEWLLGPESLEEMNDDYSRILSQDVKYRAHRDPRTGQVDGLEVTKVKSGSLVASHGVQEGEVLKSINGHRVTGVNDAIAFVKREADTTDTWIAIFEYRGREIRRVYHSPPPE